MSSWSEEVGLVLAASPPPSAVSLCLTGLGCGKAGKNEPLTIDNEQSRSIV